MKDHIPAAPRAARRLRCTALLLAVSSVFLLAAIARADVEIGRRWANTPPTIDGTFSPGEWNGALVTPLIHGKMLTMNDGQFLYVLLDVVDDTTNNAPAHNGPNTGDSYTLAFDIDQNHAVTPNVDMDYDSCNDGTVFSKNTYLGGGSFTSCQTPAAASQGAMGFGPSPFSATNHRIWEFRLSLAEIGVDTSTWTTTSGTIPKVRMNVTTVSENPAFNTSQPDPNEFPDFTGSLYQVDLATSPNAYPPGGAGPIFAGVGLVPRNYIDGAGYANINIAGYYSATAAPFGGSLNIFGNWVTLRALYHARSYRVLYSKNGGPLTHLRQTWTNFKFNYGTGNWDPVAIGPDANDEYQIPPAGQLWYLPNLLATWQTPSFGDGTYTLSLQLFDALGNPLPSPSGNSMTLFVDNTPPVPVINSVNYDGTPACACAIVTQGSVSLFSYPGFTWDISATDANGALNAFSLYGIYGDNQNTGTIYSDSYSNHVNADGPEKWNGVTHLVVPAGLPWRAPASCAYSFILASSSRVQNGYGLVFPEQDYHVSLTILLGSGSGSVAGCGGITSAQESPSGPSPMGLKALK